jgi:hypothetical protein
MSGFLDDLPDLGFQTPGEPRRSGRLGPKKPSLAAEVDCVSWTSVHCPKCGSADCPIVDSRQIPVRWHECRNPDCPARTDAGGYRFKSIERNYQAPTGEVD